MRTFCVGDIHGGYRGLVQVLEKVNFDYENDILISLGDVTDGWSETAEAIEELMRVKNLVYIKGNHDEWTERFLDFTMKHGERMDTSIWLEQGGRETYYSYVKHPDLVDKHLEFLRQAKLYHIDGENRLFLHAGFDPDRDIDDQKFMDVGQSADENATYYWDRKLWREMKHYDLHNVLTAVEIKPYKEVYIGHTPTSRDYDHGNPVNIGNLWNMDTGAAYDGKITLMNLDTKEFVQSDPLYTLYPNETGRNGVFLLRHTKDV